MANPYKNFILSYAYGIFLEQLLRTHQNFSTSDH